jgi:guanylate kinase
MAVVTLTGPTCAGKSALEAELQRIPGVGRAISHTTRLPRAGEVDGVNYFFITDDKYIRMKWDDHFVETIDFGSASYALSAKSLNDAAAENTHVVIVVEPNGAQQVHDFCASHNIKSFAVWVDCTLREQSRRWVSRLTGDMLIGKEVVAAYSQRLELMMGEECVWRVSAFSNAALSGRQMSKKYDLLLNSTDKRPDVLAMEVMSIL